jgi:hypothetical protein
VDNEIKHIDIEAAVAKRALQFDKELEEALWRLFNVPSEYFTDKKCTATEVRNMRGILWTMGSTS